MPDANATIPTTLPNTPVRERIAAVRERAEHQLHHGLPGDRTLFIDLCDALLANMGTETATAPNGEVGSGQRMAAAEQSGRTESPGLAVNQPATVPPSCQFYIDGGQERCGREAMRWYPSGGVVLCDKHAEHIPTKLIADRPTTVPPSPNAPARVDQKAATASAPNGQRLEYWTVRGPFEQHMVGPPVFKPRTWDDEAPAAASARALNDTVDAGHYVCRLVEIRAGEEIGNDRLTMLAELNRLQFCVGVQQKRADAAEAALKAVSASQGWVEGGNGQQVAAALRGRVLLECAECSGTGVLHDHEDGGRTTSCLECGIDGACNTALAVALSVPPPA